MTLTRTAFQATLEVADAAGNVELDNVQVTLKVTDANQNDASSLFGIPPPVLTNIGDISGTGVIQPGTTASVAWTITPTRDAAPMTPTQYFVGGELDYTQSGTQIKIPLFPAPITVQPDPFLMFRYFLQRNIFSDDPFTTQIEPAEPFSLGLLVVNEGYGTAHSMKITTSQPQIVDNAKGLLIDFQIIGAQVNIDPVSPSLDVNMGDIGPQSTACARWILTSSLQGQFIDFSASFEHVDDLGSPRTSLIDSVDTHSLEHVVRVVDPADDQKPDFLAIDNSDPIKNPDALPDTLYNSDATVSPVTALTDATVDGPVTDAHLVVQLNEPASSSGFVYFRIDDPGGGNYQLLQVIRSDGKNLLLPDNAWTTNRTVQPLGGTPYKQYRFYLFDKDTTGAYTLIYGQPAAKKGTVGGSKMLADGTQVVIDGVVSAKFSDGIYVEATDRSSGIRVTGQTAPEGTAVTVAGTLGTDANGQRYLAASTLNTTGSGLILPLGANLQALYGADFFYDSQTGAGQRGMTGGAGLNPTGLLMSALGKVVATSSGTVFIDDGYGQPVQVLLPTGVQAPTVNTFVVATGVVTLIDNGGVYAPVLRPRRASDLFTQTDAQLRLTFTSPDGQMNVGSNLFSLPGVPVDPYPPHVLNHLDPGDGSGLQGRLTRYDAPTQQEIFWDAANPGAFGNLLLDQGYRVEIDAGENPQISFDGYRADFADHWVSLPFLGVTRIGHPYIAPVDWASVQVTDGTKTVSLTDAVNQEFPPWLSSVAQYYDSVQQAPRNLGLPQDNPDSTQLMSWTGYWVTGYRDNIALIVPSQYNRPTLTALIPSQVAAGGPKFVLMCAGSGFTGQSVVYWNGSARKTTYVSATQLIATIRAADIHSPGSAQVMVVNGGVSGAASNALPFVIGTTNLQISAVRSLTRSSGTISATVTITNRGSIAAANVQITASTLNGTSSSTTPLPSIPQIAAGGSTSITLSYPDTAGQPGAKVILNVKGTYSGGKMNGSFRVKLP